MLTRITLIALFVNYIIRPVLRQRHAVPAGLIALANSLAPGTLGQDGPGLDRSTI